MGTDNRVKAKPVFGALLLWGHKDIDPTRLGLHIRDYADDAAVQSDSKVANESSTNNGHNGVTNGAANDATTAPIAGNTASHTDGTTASTAV